MRPLTLTVLLVLVSRAAAADWPQWRGPDRSGSSKETGLLAAWPKEGPPLVWKATGLGGGYASPSVAQGKIFLMGSKGEEEFLFALDASAGKQLWSTRIGKVGFNDGPNYPGPRAAPTVVGELLYTLGSDGDLVCARVDSGKVVWRRHLENDFEGKRGTWAYTESPLIDGDVLVCTPGGAKACLVGLDRMTGKVLWQTAKRSANFAGYASAVIAHAGKTKLYVQFLGAGVVGVDARDGRLLWEYRKNVGTVNAATPVVHDGLVFTSATGDEGAGGDALLRLVPAPAGVEIKEVYFLRNLMNFHGGVVRIGEHLYGAGRGGMVCIEFRTGKLKWRHRSIGHCSLLAADGHLYLRGQRGEVALVEATPAGYREKGRFSQPDRSRFNTFAHPVLANGRLYLRDAGVLLCYDVKAR
jgi:outer membrane protein assembly factor BamB